MGEVATNALKQAFTGKFAIVAYNVYIRANKSQSIMLSPIVNDTPEKKEQRRKVWRELIKLIAGIALMIFCYYVYTHSK